MILFVFEGAKTEVLIKNALQKYFKEIGDNIVFSYGNNIYNLYKDAKQNGLDITRMIAEKKTDFKPNKISETYLFFDYDFHNNSTSLDESNECIKEMLDFFNDETQNGKLYISYPMVEAIRYTKTLPDSNFHEYTIKRDECKNFKHLASRFSSYDSMDYLCSRKYSKACWKNWKLIIKQNIFKANYICRDSNDMPISKADICQRNIFEAQIKKYVINSSVAILAAFPLFIYDYYNQSMLSEILD